MNFISSTNTSSTLLGSTSIVYGINSGFTLPGISNVGLTKIIYSGSNDVVTSLLIHCDGTNGSTTFVDSSSYNATLTSFNSAQISTSQYKFGTGSMYLPNAGTAYVLTPSSTNYNFGTGNFTIEFWMNWSGTYSSSGSGYQRVMSNKTGVYLSGNWIIGWDNVNNNGTAHLGFATQGYPFYSAQTVLSPSTANIWYHYAFVRNGTSFYIYVNGILESISSIGSISVDSGTTNPLTIGGNPGDSQYFYGYLDEIRITKGYQQYTPNFALQNIPYTSDSNVVLLMNCDGLSGSSNLIDSSSYNATLTSTNSALISSTQYKFGSGSLYLPNSSNAYVLTPTSTNYAFGTGNFTIEFWLYWSGTYSTTGSGWQRVMSNKTGAFATNTWIIGWDNSTNNGTAHIAMQIFNVASTPFYSSTTVPVANTWYHFAFVRNGSYIYVYTNGIVEAIYTIGTTSLDGGIACPLTIGGNPGDSQYIYGYIDEIRITKGVARYGNFTVATTPFILNSPTTLYLPGTSSPNSYLSFNTNHPVNFDTRSYNFFVEAWISLNSIPASGTDYYIINKGTYGYAAEDIGLRILSSGYCQFYTYILTGSAITIDTGLPLQINTLYHIAAGISINGNNGTIYIYLNGVLKSSTVLSTLPRYTVGSIFNIGTPVIQSDWVATNAYIQDLRVVKGGTIPTLSFTPSGIPFGVNSPTYTTNMGQTVLSLYTQHFYPTYLNLPGVTGSYVTLANNTTGARVNTSTTNMFIEAWCYFNTLTGVEQYIAGVITIASQTNDDWGLRWDNSANTMQFYHYNAAGGLGSVFANSTINTKQWYHIAAGISYTSSNIYLYINGILQNAGGTTVSGIPRYTSASTLWIGSPGNNTWGPSSMYIQDLRILANGNIPISSFTPSQAPFGYSVPGYTNNMGANVFSLSTQHLRNITTNVSPYYNTVSATGGNSINLLNGNRIHIYSNVGTSTFTVPTNSTLSNVQVLIVGGGGGGGSVGTGGGGGAGGLIYLNSISLSNGSYTVTVGSGGNPGSAGGNSVFSTYTALGGGTGGHLTVGGNGGSGGGSTDGNAAGSATQSPTGGDSISIVGNNKIHTFTTVGTQTFTVPSGLTLQAQILIVGGGGGAGYDGGGGGGGGGVIYYSNVSIPAGSYTVTVGGGGAAATSGTTNGVNGGSSSVSGLGLTTALGGAGGMDGHAASVTPLTGGCGGGGGHSQNPDNGLPSPLGYGTFGQGFNGGSAYYNSAGGGGGGAGGVGVNAANAQGGNGGTGIANSISGTSTYYGGGGAGGSWNGAPGAGGLGGGGQGGGNHYSGTLQNATSGTANTGGGGGGNGFATDGASGSGGSGIVIISYSYLPTYVGYFGNAGGGSAATAQYGTGGGGGAAAAGTTGTTTAPGNGGNGLLFNISGIPTYYAGGGGGGWNGAAYGGSGGLGGGGNGGNNATSGTPNTGGGGGGANNFTGSTLVSGSGGSGIVIISYPYTGNVVVNTNTVNTPLYGFNYFLFTSIGATGASGPTSLSGYGTIYPGIGTSYPLTILNSTSGIQVFKVPQSGYYTFIVAGATGGYATGVAFAGGTGQIVSGTVYLQYNTTIYIVVGQYGGTNAYQAAGGGGSFVFKNSLTFNNLLFAAGGGGGATHGTAGGNGQTVLSGTNGTQGSGGQGNGGAGGTSGAVGNGGYNGTNTTLSYPGNSATCAGGGGANVNQGGGGGGAGVRNIVASSASIAGSGFIGGAAGTGGSGAASAGGFGGGAGSGAGGGGGGGAGGGGGYSGGGGGGGSTGTGGQGGGGGSYCTPLATNINLNYGTNPSSTTLVNNGYVIIRAPNYVATNIANLSVAAQTSLVASYSLRALNPLTPYVKVANINRGPSGTFPPSALSSTAMTGQSVSGITYTVSSSSSAAGPAVPNAWNAFDKTTGSASANYWQSAGVYNTTTGVYQGTSNVAGYPGEWLQIQLSKPLLLTSYSVQSRNDTYGPLQTPLSWYLLGCNIGGASWTLLDQRSAISWTAGQTQTFTINSPSNLYTNFILIGSNVAANNTYGTTSISEMVLFSSGLSQDFYATSNGSLYTTSNINGIPLLSWLNGATGYITKWYDQSSSSYDLGDGTTGTVIGSQPAINTNTTPYSLLFDGSTSYLYNSSMAFNFGTGIFTFRYVVSNSAGGCVLFKAIGTAFTWTTPHEKKFWLGDGTSAEGNRGNYPSEVGNSENYYLSSSTITSTSNVKNSVVHKATSTTTVPIYINGSAATIGTTGLSLATDPGNYLIIGAGGNAAYYQGNLFEIQIFSTALSDSDRLILEN